MDINRFNTQLRIAVDTGKVIYGTKETIKECLVGEPKLLIVSKTVKNTVKKQLAHYAKLLNIRFVEYPDKGSELGSVCGKPFNISVISIKDFG
jgi:large subunit ribosomal protein L30e